MKVECLLINIKLNFRKKKSGDKPDSVKVSS